MVASRGAFEDRFFYHPAILDDKIGRLGKFPLTISRRSGCSGSGKGRRRLTSELVGARSFSDFFDQAEENTMKRYVTLGFSIAAGAALGAGAVTAIHAQGLRHRPERRE